MARNMYKWRGRQGRCHIDISCMRGDSSDATLTTVKSEGRSGLKPLTFNDYRIAFPSRVGPNFIEKNSSTVKCDKLILEPSESFRGA